MGSTMAGGECVFRIGEFSKLTQVSIRMLRYYDEAGLLRPQRVDDTTGYRLYSTAQIPRLRRILFLRDIGFGVAEMGEVLEDLGGAGAADRLQRRGAQTRREIAALQRKLEKIELALRDIDEGQIGVHCNVTIQRVPGCRVLSLRRVIPDYYAEGALWKEMAAFAGQHGVAISGRTFSIYHDSDYSEQGVDVELCAPVAVLGEDVNGFAFRFVEAVEEMACATVTGSFENIAAAYDAFAGWLERHPEYVMGVASRQIVHRGPWNEPDPAAWLTEMQIPLQRRITP